MSPAGPPGFPAMKAKQFRRLLRREFGYKVVRQQGSHRSLRSPTHPPLTLYHADGADMWPPLIRKILVQDVGLTLEQAKEVVKRA